MSGTTLNLSLSEGVSVSAPTQTSSNPVFANDAAFVTAKGSSAAVGDTYFSSVTDTVREYTSGGWRSLGTLDGTETLTNKTFTSPTINSPNISGGTASNSIRNVLPANTTSNLTALTRVAGIIAYDSTKQKVVYDNGTALQTVGSGSSGINYISANSDAEADATGWATYLDAAGTIPVDGTGGSPSSTFTRSTSTPLRGTASFLWTKSAANRQGEGFSYDFTIDDADRGKVLSIGFDQKLISGTYVDGDMIVYIYDITNTSRIEPVGKTIQSITAGIPFPKNGCTFQTSISSTSYRLICHTSTTSALAYSMMFDNFYVGPQISVNVPSMSDWTLKTVTGSWVTNTTYTCYEKIVGDTAFYDITVSLTGAPTANTLSVNLPSGRVINKPGAAQYVTVLGDANFRDTGTANYLGNVIYNDTTSVYPFYYTASGANAQGVNTSHTAPFTFGSGDFVHLLFSVPIVGLSSNSVASADTDTRVIALQVGGTASTISGTIGVVKLSTVVVDSAGSYNPITGLYTVSAPGNFFVAGQIQTNQASIALGNNIIAAIYKNGSVAIQNVYSAVSISSQQLDTPVSGMVSCVAGDTIALYAKSDATTPTIGNSTNQTFLSLHRLSGSSLITASESVQCSYYTSANGTVSTTQDFNFDTKIYDSYSAVSASAAGTGTWTFRAPMSGVFNINSTCAITTTALNYITIFKNGAFYDNVGGFHGDSGDIGHANYDIRLLQGDTISLRLATSKTWFGGALSADHCGIQIKRVGNY